jgi:hypothetical protein
MDGKHTYQFPAASFSHGESQNGFISDGRRFGALLRTAIVDFAQNGHQYLNEPFLLGRAVKQK